MKTIYFLSFCLLLSASSYSATIRRVLFLGNSYTYVNNLPQLVANMARATGDSLVFDSYVPGGYTLDQHATDPVALGKVMLGNWDYLVLQEQSQLPGIPNYYSNNLSSLCELFRTYNPCGRLMFYMTWGRKNGDANNCTNFPSMCTYISMDNAIRTNYIIMAQTRLGDLSPVGAAWRYVRQHSPAIDLYQADESHPSEAGSYLAACSFYTAIFKKNPALLSYNFVLSTADANTIKQAAKLVVFDSLSYWRYSPTTLTADFGYQIVAGGNQALFLNTTSTTYRIPVADSYLWDFGDGSTSTLKDPTHSYAGNGTYIVTLTSYNCDVDTTYRSTHRDTISFCSYTPTVYPGNLKLCPGVRDTLWTQNYDAYQWYDEYSNAIPNATNRYYVCTGPNKYYVKVSQNGCKEASVPVLVDAYSGVTNQFSIVESGNMAGEDTVCAGSSLIVSLMYSKPPYPADSLIDWTYNGLPITGYHNDTLTITAAGTYSATVRHDVCPGLDKTITKTYTFVNCPLSVNEQVKQPAVTVYPNSGNGLFNMVCKKEVRIAVYDAYGRNIKVQHFNAGTHLIDLRDQAAGMYFVSFFDDNTRGYVRLVKE